VDDVTAIQLKRISEFRQEVVVASERSFADAAIKGVSKYLPELFGLMNACEKMPPDFSRHLHIDWTSAMGTTAINGRHSNWYWECMNVLYSLGLLYRKLASDTLLSIQEDQFSERWTEVVKLLSSAAGILTYVSESVASRFFVFPKDMPMPEVFPETFAMLARVSLAECQELVTKRAILKENNPVMAAQLAISASQEYDLCASMADKIQIPEKKDSWLIKLPTRRFLEWKAIIWRAIAQKFMAEYHIWKQEPGTALGYLEIAVSTIDSLKADSKAMDPNTDLLWDIYEKTRAEIKQLHTSTNKDNDNIFHEIVRRELVLPIQSKFLAKAIEFVPPQAADVTVQTKDATGLNLCVIQ
jgi:hypothetical protein